MNPDEDKTQPSKSDRPDKSAIVRTVRIPEAGRRSLDMLTAALSKPRAELVDQTWLDNLSVEELIDLMALISQKLKEKVGQSTSKIATISEARSFPAVQEADIKDFVRLPASAAKGSEATAPVWRIVLTSDKPAHKPIGLELLADVKMGRAVKDMPVDLDLRACDAEDLGVSRQHAMLHPTADKLWVIDLGSTNGTYCDGKRAGLGKPLELKDNSVLSLGELHFHVKVVNSPKKPIK